MEITMTIKELESLLDEQKKVTSEFMTRNLSCYHWWNVNGVDSDKARGELIKECNNSGYPSDFKVLKKYLTNTN